MQRHLQRQVVHLSTRRQTPLPRRVVSLDVAYRSWAPGKTFGAGRCAVVCRYSEHAEPVNPGKEVIPLADARNVAGMVGLFTSCWGTTAKWCTTGACDILEHR